MMEIGMMDLTALGEGQGAEHPGLSSWAMHQLRHVPEGLPAQGVRPGRRRVRLVKAEACMECGACQMNCPAEAIKVDSGVGCAAAMIMAALKGKDDEECGEECCR